MTTTGPKAATAATVSAQQRTLDYLDFDNRNDFDDVNRGLVAPLPDNGVLTKDDGTVIWNLPALQYGSGSAAPETVSPSLWRQGQLMGVGGLFKVTEGIYQVRNHDLANVTFVETSDSIVVIDTGTCSELAAVALALYYEHRPNKPVRTVIHPHPC